MKDNTLIPVLEHFQQRFDLSKPIVIADAGLLSTPNIKDLRSRQYEFILGARLKNEGDEIKDQILALSLADGDFSVIKMPDCLRLIASYSEKRAKKDLKDRERGIERLEENLNKGKLTKSHIEQPGVQQIPET